MTKENLGKLIIEAEESLYRVAKSLLYNDADCADAISEAIVKAFENLPKLRNDKYAKTWLIRILINECYATMRREKKIVSLESLPESGTEMRDHTDLYRAVNTLPEKLRIAVILYYSEGFSVKEIAMIEDTTESAIKNRLLKARKKLKELLDSVK